MLIGQYRLPFEALASYAFVRPKNPSERRYNVAHKQPRCVIERAYGIRKLRFRCLHKTGGCLTFSPERNINIIVSKGILCKHCVRRNEPLLDDEDLDDDGDDMRMMVGCFGFNGPLRQYFSLYQAVSQREGERGEKG